ncbi:MAG: sigma 54-interacting transcriptional regulator [Desulfobacterales bacterium]|uniref:Sigma 54-interacting transcriptional regulator n=1 Tax=Candidatus Desulfatibia vada TaxID=2841696 RepID=A0A8J6NRT3_9BACT|nr:sigma 54-interacting transcriptional regulator [Candidatus Desulfatibia vada]MBL6971436.1 sigma 54-interacting transcriptional regulator [Desulfobacterales bacterium]
MFEQDLNQYWKTVVDTIQDGVMIVGIKGTIVSVNKGLEKITGYTRSELIGKPCLILDCNICEIVRENKGEHWCKLFRDGTVDMRKCLLTKKDGSNIHVLKNASLLHDTEGQVMGAVETMTDITEIIVKDTQIEAFRRQLLAEDGFHGILGISVPMRQVFDMIANAAQSDAPVIIFGESGTGKELISKAIHDVGKRKRKPFVKVNCAALTESLLESELFGHVKGAYTGAYQNREGRFEAAKNGDIFLDEIGDLPLSTQVKLLRVLEEKVVERVGDNRPIHIDVRIISATNKDLMQLVAQGVFRKDLFYRINVIPITVPPLRERAEDIPILAESFFRRIKLKGGKNIQGISSDAMGILMEHSWPGNVRELKSAFEYCFVTCQEDLIQPHHLPPAIFQGKKSLPEAKKTPNKHYDIKKLQLVEALEKAGGNQSEAARILGVSRVTVWNRMKRFNINLKKEYKI